MNKIEQKFHHIPVLLSEVLEFLDPHPNENFVDATLGGGGYAKAILERIEPGGQVLAIDLDEDAIENFQFLIFNFQKNHKSEIINQKSAILHHGNFRDIDKIIKHHDFPAPDGIVADLGLSSYQLDQAGRGISFQKKEILDMRFDKSSTEPDARFILNNYDAARLRRIFEDYGEERYARQIIKKILQSRVPPSSRLRRAGKGQEIKYTTDLYQIIVEALPKPVKHRADDSARRIFQALRIEVNHELGNLREFLPKAFDLLKVGGRLAVVSFHSLEDRIVKKYFAGLSKGCVCPPEFPQCICGKKPQGKVLTKKPVVASAEEIAKNPRSKPAKLRVIEKI